MVGKPRCVEEARIAGAGDRVGRGGEADPLPRHGIRLVLPPGDRQVDAGAGAGIARQRAADAELVDLAEPFVGTRIADLPTLVAILAAESEPRGEPLAERAREMAPAFLR